MSITLKGYSSIVHFSKWCLINGCVTHRFPSLCHLKSGTTTSFFYFLNFSGLFLLLAPLAKPSHNYVPFYQLPRLLLQCALSQTKQNNFAHCCPFYRTLSYIRTYGSFLIHCDISTSLIYKLANEQSNINYYLTGFHLVRSWIMLIQLAWEAWKTSVLCIYISAYALRKVLEF